MIVVDSSVWISLTRNIDSNGVRALESRLKTREILVGDLILTEVLQGCRTEKEVVSVERLLSLFEADTMLGSVLARKAAANYRYLRQSGVTPRSTIDVMIATYCLDRDYALLTEDRDFRPMAQHLGLRLI